MKTCINITKVDTITTFGIESEVLATFRPGILNNISETTYVQSDFSITTNQIFQAVEYRLPDMKWFQLCLAALVLMTAVIAGKFNWYLERPVL